METTKARREAAVLFFVVFVLGVVLGGVGNHLWGQRVWGGQTASSTKVTRQQIIDESTRQLQLTPDQQQKFAAILQQTHDRWQALYAPVDIQKEQIRQEGRAQIRAILTPEQQVKFDQLMRQVDEQRRKEAAH